jgi:hypothetical protein
MFGSLHTLPDGKGLFALGKFFAEFYTRQRTLDKYFIGKWFFDEYFFEHSINTLPSAKNGRQRKELGKLRTTKTAKHFLIRE